MHISVYLRNLRYKPRFYFSLPSCLTAPSGFPQNVTATTISPTEIEISWNEVLEGERNGNITHYEIRYSQSTFSSIAGNSTILTDSPVLKLLLQNLEEFVEYTFTVRAYTVIGPGPFSPAVVNTTFEDSKYIIKPLKLLNFLRTDKYIM